jgi:carboxyl-terminal processing protease
MKKMNRLIRLANATLALTLAVGATSLFANQDATAAQPAPLARVDNLTSEAFRALVSGNIDRTSELLKSATERSSDPSVAQMALWVSQFQQQRADFAAERKKQFDKEVELVHKLLEAGKESFALNRANVAYTLAEDKDAFRKLDWVDSLIRTTTALAAQFESNQQWFKALRVYSDLVVIEPANPAWKEKLKLATRRLSLLAMYTPDDFRKLSDLETKEREAADRIVNPDAKPPSTQPAEEEEENSFKTDWRDSLRNVTLGMLIESLDDARTNYWKDVNYRMLLRGGLQGLRALATTPGLEGTFPGLANQANRDKFVAAIDEAIKTVNDVNRIASEQMLTRSIIVSLKATNDQTVKLPENVFVHEFASGAFAELDPFTGAIWPSELDEFAKSTQGEFFGVGIQISNDEAGNLKVVSPLEDSPAWRQGVRAGSIVTHINGKSAKGVTTSQAVKIITGPEGTNVTLRIRDPEGVSKDFTMTRERIKVASVKSWYHQPGGKWDYFPDPENRIAYLRITNFTKSTAEELERAINDLRAQGAKALILDLRYNPGGLLQAATEVSDQFIRKGVIVSTKADRAGAQTPPPLMATDSKNDVDWPMVVLVNQYSASASEIVSGALKDHNRAWIVGERTFGKGSVQMLYALANRTAYLKLTTSHYYLPSDRNIHREENSTVWGVDPDFVVEMTPKQMNDAIEARSQMDVLRREGEDMAPATKPADKNLLDRDAQLHAALLLLRLQIAGNFPDRAPALSAR